MLYIQCGENSTKTTLPTRIKLGTNSYEIMKNGIKSSLVITEGFICNIYRVVSIVQNNNCLIYLYEI